MNEWMRFVADFIEDRPSLRDNNQQPGRVAFLLQEEVEEFNQEADLYKKGQEAVDVIWMVLSWAHMNGVDMDLAFKTKNGRNHLKREAHLYNGDMTYEEAEVFVKNYWTPEKEKEFYE